MTKLRDRPLREIVVLVIVGTICLSVIGAGISLLIIKVLNPNEPVTAYTSALFGLIGSLISVVAGFMAGQSTARMDMKNNDIDADNATTHAGGEPSDAS